MASSDSGSGPKSRAHGQTRPSSTRRRSCLINWLRNFCKGTNRRVSNEKCPRLTGEEDSFPRGPGRSLDDQPKAEDEELDYAIALSLAEDGEKQNGRNGQGNYDDDLARAIQESLRISPTQPYDPIQYLPRGYRVCAGCKGEIGSGHYLGCKGTFWHPRCFCCYACGQAICETEFSLSGSYPYHKSCYKELQHPKCDVCHHFIPTNSAGFIEYRTHPFWGQKYCPSHEHDNTRRCCSCERMESRSTTNISLGDGRSLCPDCLDSAIMDTLEGQSLYHSIRDFYEGINMKIEQQIPVLLVERQALNEAMEGEKDALHHVPETRGLCLSEEQTVESVKIVKRTKIRGSRTFDMRTYPKKLTRRCEVTAILVLYGLPRLLTGSILAHELMHSWLRLKGYRDLRPEVEEGICQVLSHMWLESEVTPGSTSMLSSSTFASSSSSSLSPSKKVRRSTTETKLGEFFMHQIANDISPEYGEGFRAANAAVSRYGLRWTMDHIHFTGTLPM